MLLLTALISLLLSCHSEELLPQESLSGSTESLSSAKFVSRSLWKEDEVYIGKVKQVFLKIANLEHVKAQYGELNWNYAMSFGNFNETYVIVPIIKNNKVVFLMEAIRKGNRLFLYEKDNKDLIEFFNLAIYSNVTKYDEVIEAKRNMSSKVSAFVCTTRWITIGCSDNEPNCVPYTTSVTNCEFQGGGVPPKTFDPTGLDGGGGGGDDDGYEYPDPPEMNPCDQSLPSINNANDILNSSDGQQQMDNVLKTKIGDTKEWVLAIGQKPNNYGYEVTQAVQGGTSNGNVPSSQLTNPYIGDGHSHAGTRGNPSGGDLYDMLDVLKTNTNFTVRFVYGSNAGSPEIYALVVNDSSLADSFLTQFPKDTNYNPTDHSILIGSKLGDAFYEMKTSYMESLTTNTSGEQYEARAVAMAYILDKYNAGISIAKVDVNGNLKKINASIEKETTSNGTIKEMAVVSQCP
ncbi:MULTISPECIES: hypothetical protein [unclassified Chryseobacterium]|uniref:hypothetical protein n=1 Tax=unclassified Chryseobacterium TaxID=2593645 RepID=UPI0030105220